MASPAGPPVATPDERGWPGDRPAYDIPLRKRIAIERIAGRVIAEPPIPLPCRARPQQPRRYAQPTAHPSNTTERAVKSVCRRIAIVSEHVLVAVVVAPLVILVPAVLPVVVRGWLRKRRDRAENRRALEVRIAQWKCRVRTRARARRRFTSYRR